MFGDLFKKKSQDEIEDEISNAVGEIISNYPSGERDFSKLLKLDKELVENQSFNPILAICFEQLVKQAENAFFCGVDIQIVLDYLKDLSTFPGKSWQGYAEMWRTHENLFEQIPERYMSMLDLDRDIEEQFNELKENVEIYEKDFLHVMNVFQKAVEKFQQRDTYKKSSLEGAYQRFSILTGLMLTDITEEQILSARKVLLAYALNGELEEARKCYEVCKKHFYGQYINLIKDDKTSVPAVDVVIGNAIMQTICGDDLPGEEFSSYTAELNRFTDEFSGVEEMHEQIVLCVDVFKYLGLYGGEK